MTGGAIPVVDPDHNAISFNGREVQLEPRVIDLMCVLAEQPGTTFSRDQLIDRVWGIQHGGDSSLSRAISLLRKALRECGDSREYIATIARRGYSLALPVEVKRSEASAKASNPASLQAPEPPAGVRLAVLPLRSQSVPDDGGFFAEGLADELITLLGSLKGLLVAGRVSSFGLKGTDLSLEEIGAKLNVTHIVSGSVRRFNEQVRVDISLTDVATGFETWTYCYDGELDQMFAQRDVVSQSVGQGVGETLGLAYPVTKPRRLTDNREAYALYLQGRALTIRAIGDGVMERAVALLEQALELDPEFSECWTALAEAHINVAVYTKCLNRLERGKMAADCARKAIALSDRQGHAKIVLAFEQWTLDNACGAIDLAVEAYALEPTNADVLNRLGAFLLYIGQTRRALSYIEASIAQDPVNGRAYLMLSCAHLSLGNINEAIVAGQRMVDLRFPSMFLGIAYAAKGDHERGVVAYRQTQELMQSNILFSPAGTREITPAMSDAYWDMGSKGVCSGDEDARKAYAAMLEYMHQSLHDPADAAICWPAVWIGEAELLFKTLGKQITPGNFFCLASLWSDAGNSPAVRNHPDFVEFSRKIGLDRAWEKYGYPDIAPQMKERMKAVRAGA
ncbi:MAG: winged helix-turn-helix domain-containing protein [Erythrobacter sp.]